MGVVSSFWRAGVSAVLCASTAFVVASGAPVVDEYRLKAAIVLRAPQFVEWPSAALAHRPTVDVCVLAPNPFGTALQELVAGERLGSRKLVVRQVSREEATGCHVLFVPAAAPGRALLLRRLKGSPILTMSDAADFIADGGVMQLHVAEQRVRFDINAGAAERAGLKLSAQLLRLAQTVHEKRP